MSPAAFQSQRSDGRGHYPKGKRRSTLTRAQHRLAMVTLKRLIKSGFSRNEIGRVISVEGSTVAKWAKGEDWPTRDSLRKLRAFPRV